MSLDEILALPTWVLYLAIRPWLPAGHPLRRGVTFAEWAGHATNLTLAFGLIFWVYGLAVLFLAVIYLGGAQ